MGERTYYYELVDEEASYGIIACDVPEEKFEELVEEYKMSDEEYNVDGLLEFLEEKGVNAYYIEPTQIYF